MKILCLALLAFCAAVKDTAASAFGDMEELEAIQDALEHADRALEDLELLLYNASDTTISTAKSTPAPESTPLTLEPTEKTPEPVVTTTGAATSTSDAILSTTETTKSFELTSTTDLPIATTEPPITTTLTSTTQLVTSAPDPISSRTEPTTSAAEIITSAAENVTSTAENVTSIAEHIALTAEPIASTAEPITSIDELITSTAEPITSTPESITSTPEPITSAPEPITSTPESITSTPEPITSTPEPITSTPEPITSTPESITSTPEPITSTPEPITSTPEPITSTPEPITSTAKPITSTAEPIHLTAEPIISTAEPIPSTPQPIHLIADPVTSTAESIPSPTEPTMSTAAPARSTTEQEIPTKPTTSSIESTSQTEAESNIQAAAEESTNNSTIHNTSIEYSTSTGEPTTSTMRDSQTVNEVTSTVVWSVPSTTEGGIKYESAPVGESTTDIATLHEAIFAIESTRGTLMESVTTAASTSESLTSNEPINTNQSTTNETLIRSTTLYLENESSAQQDASGPPKSGITSEATTFQMDTIVDSEETSMGPFRTTAGLTSTHIPHSSEYQLITNDTHFTLMPATAGENMSSNTISTLPSNFQANTNTNSSGSTSTLNDSLVFKTTTAVAYVGSTVQESGDISNEGSTILIDNTVGFLTSTVTSATQLQEVSTNFNRSNPVTDQLPASSIISLSQESLGNHASVASEATTENTHRNASRIREQRHIANRSEEGDRPGQGKRIAMKYESTKYESSHSRRLLEISKLTDKGGHGPSVKVLYDKNEAKLDSLDDFKNSELSFEAELDSTESETNETLIYSDYNVTSLSGEEWIPVNGGNEDASYSLEVTDDDEYREALQWLRKKKSSKTPRQAEQIGESFLMSELELQDDERINIIHEAWKKLWPSVLTKKSKNTMQESLSRDRRSLSDDTEALTQRRNEIEVGVLVNDRLKESSDNRTITWADDVAEVLMRMDQLTTEIVNGATDKKHAEELDKQATALDDLVAEGYENPSLVQGTQGELLDLVKNTTQAVEDAITYVDDRIEDTQGDVTLLIVLICLVSVVGVALILGVIFYFTRPWRGRCCKPDKLFARRSSLGDLDDISMDLKETVTSKKYASYTNTNFVNSSTDVDAFKVRETSQKTKKSAKTAHKESNSEERASHLELKSIKRNTDDFIGDEEYYTKGGAVVVIRPKQGVKLSQSLLSRMESFADKERRVDVHYTESQTRTEKPSNKSNSLPRDHPTHSQYVGHGETYLNASTYDEGRRKSEPYFMHMQTIDLSDED